MLFLASVKGFLDPLFVLVVVVVVVAFVTVGFVVAVYVIAIFVNLSFNFSLLYPSFVVVVVVVVVIVVVVIVVVVWVTIEECWMGCKQQTRKQSDLVDVV